MSKYYVLFPLIGLYLLTTRKNYRAGVLKASVMGLAGAALIEGEIWNKFMIKLYLAHKYREQ